MDAERAKLLEQLYHSALEFEGAERAAYLKDACGSDIALRREVESLLVHDQQAGSFIETPALEMAARLMAESGSGEATDAVVIGQTISHYRIIEKLGGGGMGIVYKARDTRLGRLVALKFLPKDFAADPTAIIRFQREARAASSLNHPNICTVYDVGQEEGRAFMAMEYLDGQTLKYAIGSQSLKNDRLFRLGRQILEALNAAHAQGIIHRDVKPANIFVTQQDQVKVLDFGLAKQARTNLRRVSAAPASSSLTTDISEEQLTSPGTAVGTVAYMSPEQARGEDVDVRTDLFSFGVVFYEMATGQCAFRGKSCAVVFEAILNRDPVAPSRLNPGLAGGLEHVIMKALQKNREQRYQSAAEILADFGELETGRIQAIRGRSSRRLWLPTVLALVIVALLIGSALRQRRSHRLTEQDTLVLADFSNTTGDPVFDDTLKQAISVQLAQSPFLDILSEPKTRATLRLMAKPAGTKLTPDLARDLCQRAGSKAYIAGSISNLGRQYVIGLAAVNCETGDLLAQEQRTTTSKERVLSALGEATTNLRRKLGESLASIKKFDTPIDEATTPSLEALKFLSLGKRAQQEKGTEATIPYFNRAIELDPNFASAYAALGISYTNLREPALANANLRKAYELRDHVSDREKYRISAFYYHLVTGEFEKAIATYELWSQDYPRDSGPHSNLGVLYGYLGQYEKAVREVTENLRLNPDSVAGYTNLMSHYAALNRLPEARAAYQHAQARNLDSVFLHLNLYGLAFLQTDLSEMERQVTWAKGKPQAENILLSGASDTEAYYGRLRRAMDLTQQAVESALRNDQPETAQEWQLNGALREAEFGNQTRARQEIEVALAKSRSREVQILGTLALARTGESSQAEHRADDLAKQYPVDTAVSSYWLPAIRGAIEINRRRPEKAIELLRSAVPYELGNPLPQAEIGAYLYPVYLRGQAYLLLGEGQKAAEEFQKFLSHPGITVNCPLGPLARLGLARAYAVSGDKDKSLAQYQGFFGLWKNANPDLRILHDAEREYAKLNTLGNKE